MNISNRVDHSRASTVAQAAAAALALVICSVATAGGPVNDDCSNPTPISGNGTFAFDNSTATTGTDGQGGTNCSFQGTTGIEKDLWYCWTATCDGTVTIETCGQTNVNTKIALWRLCDCPPPGVDPLCCDDDSCGEQSSVSCPVICGEQYMIQLGTPPGAPGGSGSFTIDCMGTPCDEPCCIDFDDGTVNGFGPCPFAPNVTVNVQTPGPSGNAGDFYLEVGDLSNASLACGPPCVNDWSEYVDDACGAFCFDFRVFEDGCNGGIPDCVANGGWIPITPRIIISNGTTTAVFVASFTVTDANGPDPGWVTVCAPLGPLDSSGNLPSNENGAWVMSGGAPNSDWTTLLTNITEIRLPIDFTGNPAEVAGYDNICLRKDVCPCMEIIDEKILCDIDATGVPSGTYTLNFSVTNFSGVDAQYVLIPDPNVTPNVIPLSPILPGDGSQSANVTVTITNGTPGELFCFDVLLADVNIEECCATELCVELPECDCMQLDPVEVLCDPVNPGTVLLSFDLTNLTPDTVEHMFLIPQPVGTAVTITPDYVDVPTMSPFTTQSFGPFAVSGATAGDVICIRITIHDESLQECCSQDLCFTVPDCQTPFGPCDLNESGTVDVNDLLILLGAWGACPPGPCVADVTNDGQVDVGDLLLLLANWSS